MQKTVEGPGGRRLTIDDEVLGPVRAFLAGLPSAPTTRLAYGAAHIVMQPAYDRVQHSPAAPGDPEEIAEAIDWAATMAIRQRLDALGFGVAEAMDTAQRFAIGWPSARRLIEECGSLDLSNGFIAGAGADQLHADAPLDDLVEAVVEQGRIIQKAGGVVILLPLPRLVRPLAEEATFVEVYSAIIRQLDGPLCLHWLGEAFLPELRGYFPGRSFEKIMAADPEKVRACKLSLLDPDLERQIRRDLHRNGQFVLTGDDFNFAELILGDDTGPVPKGLAAFGSRTVGLGDFSHALLGVLVGIMEPASLGLRLLDQGEIDRYLEVMNPCQELGRLIFESPTAHYKAGLAFISWINGWQATFMLANHEERTRSKEHYFRVAKLAAAAGALTNAELAADRLGMLLSD